TVRSRQQCSGARQGLLASRVLRAWTVMRRPPARSEREEAGDASGAQQLGDLEGEVQALTGVEAGVAHRLVAVVEVGVAELVGTAEALRDVVARELDVHAARP